MAKQRKFEFDESKLMKVPISKVKPNEYNPKSKEDPDYEKVKRSVQLNGLTQPIFVREVEEGYEIIDGEHRHRAASDLGYEEIYVYNEGEVSDEQAKALTIWHEVGVNMQEIDLSHLVVELDDLSMELPYSEAELTDFRNMAEFDFDYDRELPEDMDEDGMTTLAIKMTPDQMDSFKGALDVIKEDNDCSDGRACELMAADYMAGYTGEEA